MPQAESGVPFDRTTWPIAVSMNQYPNILPDGRSVEEQTAEEWAATLADVADAGFTDFDPTDTWLRVADLTPSRRDEFAAVAASLGLRIPGISSAWRSVIDPERGAENLAYSHRLVEAAAAIGAGAVSFGLHISLTEAQRQALWFWTEPAVGNPDDPAIWRLAVDRIRELSRHDEAIGLEVSLEMFEDTYIGTADGAVRFVEAVGLPNVGINADIGNLIRLHRPVEPWLSMMQKVARHAKYWHVKNYLRDEDPASGTVVSYPVPMEMGLINYRVAIRLVLAHGFRSAFLLEHYGGDGLSVCATNREYLRRILPRR